MHKDVHVGLIKMKSALPHTANTHKCAMHSHFLTSGGGSSTIKSVAAEPALASVLSFHLKECKSKQLKKLNGKV
jgi:hypothetical protein